MNVISQTLSLVEAEDYQAVMSLLEENSSESLNNPDYYWLYGLALFAEGLEEEAQGIWLEGLLNQGYSETAIERLTKYLSQYSCQQIKKPPLLSIQKIYQISLIISELNEGYYDSNYFPSLQVYLGRVKREALSLAIAKKESEAKPIYEILTLLFPNDPELLYQKGMLDYELKDYESALETCLQSIRLDSANGLYYYGLGLIFEKLNNYQQAANAYSHAIEYGKNNANAYVNLCNLLIKVNDVESSLNLYKQGLDNQVSHFGFYLNYGNLLLAQDKILEAIEIYKKAIPLLPQYADIYHNLAIAYEKLGDMGQSDVNRGRALFYENKDDEAFAIFENCREVYCSNDLDYWNELCYYYVITNRYKILLEKAKQGVQRFPDSIRQRIYVIAGLTRFQRYQEAKSFTLSCIQYFDNQREKQLIFKLLNHSIIPIIYCSQEEIILTRQHYHDEFEALIQEIDSFLNREKPYILYALEVKGNHYFHFHGYNDLDFLRLYSQFFSKLIKSYFPDLVKSLALPKIQNRKIRIGYICARTPALGKLFLGWLKFHNREIFEIFFYDLGNERSSKTEPFNIFSDHYFYGLGDIEQIARRIRQESLDILVFLDAVIEPKLHHLSFFRLAPVQCATWGHPMTTGSPQVDYFLGSDAMEPANAQEHYSETLIRLPNLGIYRYPVEVSEIKSKTLITRTALGLKESDIVYVSCQMLPKYLPEYDYWYPEIVKQVPNAKVLFFGAYEGETTTQVFKERLMKVFISYKLNFEESCLFSPHLEYEEYLSILLWSDIFLDTARWSGCITSLDAIACGLPIVTMPGELMRGRQTYGMLKIMGVEETIAYNEAEYIQLAVKLGLDQNLREQVSQKICQNSHKLYYDRNCIDVLEKFYCDAVNFAGAEPSNELSHQD